MDQVERGAPINCTAGAVPIKNEKGKPKNANSVEVLSHCLGFYHLLPSPSLTRARWLCLRFTGELTMKKVKVSRYVAGKR